MITLEHLNTCRFNISKLVKSGHKECSCDELFETLDFDDNLKQQFIDKLESDGLIKPLNELGQLLPYSIVLHRE